MRVNAVAEAQAPAVTVQAETAETPIATKSYAELDSESPTLQERGNQLNLLAQKAAKADGIDKEAYRLSTVNAGTAAFSAFGAATAAFMYEGEVRPVLAAGVLTLGTIAVSISKFSPHVNSHTLEPAEAFSLQCLRVDEEAQDKHGKVAIAIHPNLYGDERPPTSQSKYRIAEALQTVAAAVDKDTKGVIGSIVIPAENAAIAGIPGTRQPYEAALAGIKPSHKDFMHVPYVDAQEAVVIPAHLAGQMAELAMQDKDALLTRVFSELAQRFPAKREALSLENAAVVKVLHGMLERAVSEGSGVRTVEKAIEKVVVNNKDGSASQIDAWTGGYRTKTEDVTTYVNRGNKFNPLVTQRTSESLREVANNDLRTMTGGPETMLDVVGKLNGSKYGKVELIRVALELLEEHEQREEDKAQEQEAAWVADDRRRSSIYALKRGGEYDERHPHRFAAIRKFAGRLALAATATFGVFLTAPAPSAIGGGTSSGDDKPAAVRLGEGQTGIGGEGQGQIWRIDEHGLEVKNPYWSQHAHYVIDPEGKPEVDETWGAAIALPSQVSPETPHITVTTMTNEVTESLPIEEGTKVSAVRAYTAGNVALGVAVLRRPDGVVTTYVDATGDLEGTVYRLEYDLTESNQQVITPSAPVMLQRHIEDDLVYPEDYPGTEENTAAYISGTFIYDANAALAHNYDQATSTREYVDKVYETGRCKCDQCNITALVLEAAKDPIKDRTYVTGYLHDGSNSKGGRSYLGDGPGHAWMNDGTINDATAANLDASSVVSSTKPVDNIEGLWDKKQKEWGLKPEQGPNKLLFQLGLISLASTGALMVLDIESRKRYMRNAFNRATSWDRWYTAAADIDPRDAVRLLQWHTYATQDSPLPPIDGGKSYRGEHPDSIPSAVLYSVANGGFNHQSGLTEKQRRGLQRTAHALLMERDRTPVHRAEHFRHAREG